MSIAKAKMVSQQKQGFSLVELIVAVTIVITIGTAILALIPKSFSLTAESKKMVIVAKEVSILDAEFSRDFSSIVSSLGFDGSRSHCSFWTIAKDSTETLALLHTTYSETPAGWEKTTLSLQGYLSLALTNNFPLIPKPIDRHTLHALTPSQQNELGLSQTQYNAIFRSLAFGDTNVTEKTLLETWSNPTNCPSRIETSLNADSLPAIKRFYLRRTLP